MANVFSMFLGASAFNQNLGGWNVARVTAADAMFFNAKSFNQNVGG